MGLKLVALNTPAERNCLTEMAQCKLWLIFLDFFGAFSLGTLGNTAKTISKQ